MFSHFVGCRFTLIVSFAGQKLLKLVRSHLPILAFVAIAFGVIVNLHQQILSEIILM